MTTVPDISLSLNVHKDEVSILAAWGNGKIRKIAPLVGFHAIFDAATEFYELVREHLGTETLTVEAVRSPNFEKFRRILTDRILKLRFFRTEFTIRDIFTSTAEAASSRPIYVEIDSSLAFIPWELLELDGEKFLGDDFVFYSDFRKDTDEYCIFDNSRRIRGSNVVIKAYDEPAIPFHSIEKGFLQSLSTFGIVVDFAPEIVDAASREKFYEWTNNGAYDGLHFFCHCSYQDRDFRLEVNRNQFVTHDDLQSNSVFLESSAFAFLNICEAGPNPNNRGHSFVEYLSREQGIEAILATLSPARSEDAADFAQEFYSTWLDASTILTPSRMGHALWKTRVKQRVNGVLTAHLYRVFGQAEVYLTQTEEVLEAA